MSSLHQQYRIQNAADAVIAELQTSTEELTPEQQWDVLNAHLYELEVLAEIQGEVEQ